MYNILYNINYVYNNLLKNKVFELDEEQKIRIKLEESLPLKKIPNQGLFRAVMITKQMTSGNMHVNKLQSIYVL